MSLRRRILPRDVAGWYDARRNVRGLIGPKRVSHAPSHQRTIAKMKKHAKHFVFAILGLGAICATLLIVWDGIRRTVCQTSVLEVVNVPGIRFDVEGQDCDVIAKDEAVYVYAKKTGSQEAWIFPKWRDRRTLLFQYDPGNLDTSPLPSITSASQSAILISIPEVSSVEYQKTRWDKVSIVYKIGKVDYPAKSQ
jgi:hypothetical protein